MIISCYVLVHASWHMPRICDDRGQSSQQYKTIGLDEVVQSILDYLAENDLSDMILLGHSHSGMVISGVADRALNGFVQGRGVDATDIALPHSVAMLDAMCDPEKSNALLRPAGVVNAAQRTCLDLQGPLRCGRAHSNARACLFVLPPS